jgi:hypothetical protein
LEEIVHKLILLQLVILELISARLSCRYSFQLRDSQFQLDQLIETPWLGPDFVSGIVSSIEPRISICLLNMNLKQDLELAETALPNWSEDLETVLIRAEL